MRNRVRFIEMDGAALLYQAMKVRRAKRLNDLSLR